MKKILIQVFGFLISTIGWFFVCCTLSMDYWRVSYIGGQGGSWIIKAAWYWSTLWRDCYIDSSAVANCRDYDILWVVRPTNRIEQGPIQAVRGLLLFGMAVGFFAAIFCFVGMECTYIGGKERSKDKILLLGVVLHFVGGMSCLAAYCLFANRLGRALFAQIDSRGILRYEIGPPVYLGLVGSLGIILGSVLYGVTLYRLIIPNREVDRETSRKDIAPKIYTSQNKSRSKYKEDNASSTQSRSLGQSNQSDTQESISSVIIGMADRHSFV